MFKGSVRVLNHKGNGTSEKPTEDCSVLLRQAIGDLQAIWIRGPEASLHRLSYGSTYPFHPGLWFQIMSTHRILHI